MLHEQLIADSLLYEPASSGTTSVFHYALEKLNCIVPKPIELPFKVASYSSWNLIRGGFRAHYMSS